MARKNTRPKIPKPRNLAAKALAEGQNRPQTVPDKKKAANKTAARKKPSVQPCSEGFFGKFIGSRCL